MVDHLVILDPLLGGRLNGRDVLHYREVDETKVIATLTYFDYAPSLHLRVYGGWAPLYRIVLIQHEDSASLLAEFGMGAIK